MPRRTARLPVLATLCSLCFTLASAYIPATPTNDTGVLRNETDFVQINWLPMGVSAYKDALSRQLIDVRPEGVAGYRGALVHFSEANSTAATGSPWIAMISCDPNADGSPAFASSSDAVSLALQGGASTAIMYSLMSETCELDTIFSSRLNGTLDLYVTTSQASAQAITRQFNNVSPDAYWFNMTSLQNSLNAIDNQISSLGALPASTDPSLFGSTAGASSASTSSPAAAPTQLAGNAVEYLIATIANAGANQNNGNVTTTPVTSSSGRGPANTGLAMIILYAITGCVTVLFLVVITSGAIRAMRHPERYGPRRNGGDGGNQSRAAGLTQAILDTFPVVKFLSGQGGQQRAAQDRQAGLKDEEFELDTTTVPMHVVDSGSKPEVSELEDGHAKENWTASTLTGGATAAAATQHNRHATDATAVADPASKDAPASVSEEPAVAEDTNPADVNDSVTCPICLLDFEDGDDLRILPCDARHRFHDACVVPWLLNVSSLCPLCRLDLSKDREVLEAESTEDAAPPAGRDRANSSVGGRFRNLLLPSSSNAQLRQGQPGVNAARSSSDSREGSTGAPAVAEAGAADQQPPTQSRFMRYVQQRRNRVNARQRGLSRSSMTATGIDPGMVQENMQHGLSPSGIPMSSVRP